MFEVWLAHPIGRFSPSDWRDNPDDARLVTSLLENATLEVARNTAQGFNRSEITRPMGLWALVMSAGTGSRGRRVKILNQAAEAALN